MTLDNFNLLSEEVQKSYVYRQGAYIARCWDDFHQAVMLYQLPGVLFVELNYDVNQNKVTFLFPFEAGDEDDCLPDYAMFVKLPDWLPESELMPTAEEHLVAYTSPRCRHFL